MNTKAFTVPKPLLIVVNTAPNLSSNAIVINSLYEYEAFSGVSIFSVHSEKGSFSKRTVYKSMRSH